MSFRRLFFSMRIVSWCVALLLLAWPASVLAQEAPTIENLTIELWPEFDRPGVLVIYSGELAGGGQSPQVVSLLLPAGAELNAVAYLDPTTSDLLDAQNESREIGDRTQITMTLEATNFWVEFYLLPEQISQQGGTRSFTHTWGGDLPVQHLTWHVQQPATASSLSVEPAGGQMETDGFNLPRYTVEAGPLAEGETASVSVSYDKTDDVLSESQVSPQPASQGELPVPGPALAAPESSSTKLILPIGLAVLGIALLTGGIFFYSRAGRRVEELTSAPESDAARPKMSRAERAALQRQAIAGFCTNCGNPLQPGDKFCRECGTPVRH